MPEERPPTGSTTSLSGPSPDSGDGHTMPRETSGPSAGSTASGPLPWDVPTAPAALGGPGGVVLPADSGRMTLDVVPGLEPMRLGPYLLVRHISRGGMGSVWEAVDTRLNRRVAIKVIRGGEGVSEESLERFRREARSAAKLRHPHIVPIHDVGRAGDRDYLVMALVDGVTLAEALRRRQFTYREKAELLEKISRAVQYAHEQGVVHRDLKPANVMLELREAGASSRSSGPWTPAPGVAAPGGEPRASSPVGGRARTPAPPAAKAARGGAAGAPAFGDPLVMDFGLAKDLAADVSLSQTGQIMGTPSYMPPEQADGQIKAVGPHSDVYGLGAVLYEMLTGRPPFTGETPQAVLYAVIMQDPLSPRKVVADVPRDLETICLKCLEKRPEKRYPSAAAVADDLKAWRNGENITARPATAWERTAKWARRRPAQAALVAVCVLAAAGLLAGIGFHNARLSVALDAARRSEEQALQEGEEKERQRALAQHSESLARESEQVARAEKERAEAARLATERENYVRMIALAEGRIAGGDLAGAKALLIATKPELRNWEWGRLTRLCRKEVLSIGVGVTSDTHFSPDGKALLTLSGLYACIYDTATGTLVRQFYAEPNLLSSSAFSPDGGLILTVGRTWQKVFNARTGEELAWFRGHSEWGCCGVFSPDGTAALTGARDNTARLWDAATGRELLVLKGHGGAVVCVAFLAGGRRILTGSEDRTARVWDARTGEELFRLAAGQGPIEASPSPDGKTILTGDGHTVRAWDAATGQEAPYPPLEAVLKQTQVRGILVTDDGKRLLTLNNDRISATLWDPATGEPLTTITHRAPIEGLCFSPDGKRVATVGGHAVSLWDCDPAREVVRLRPSGKDPYRFDVLQFGPKERYPAAIRAVVFSPTGRDVLTGSESGRAVLYDALTGREVRSWQAHRDRFRAAFSPDGQRIVTACANGEAEVWDARTGKALCSLSGQVSGWSDPAFRPDGETCLTVGLDHTLRVSDAQTGRELRVSRPDGMPVFLDAWGAHFSSDGRRLAGTVTGEVRFWDVETGTVLQRFPGGFVPYHPLAVSADGQLFAATEDGPVGVFSAATGARLASLSGHSGTVSCLSFSPDGTRVVTGSSDHTAKLWDVASGREVFTLGLHEQGLSAVAFSPDGSSIATGAEDGRTIIFPADWRPVPDRWGELPLAELLPALIQRLRDLNPNYGGQYTYKAEKDQLTELELGNAKIADIAPLRGLRLKRLKLRGTRVADLGPLKEMPLTDLDLVHTSVKDIGPLKGMALRRLDLGFTPVGDLSPLHGMPLEFLDIFGCPNVRDLSPLREMRLTRFACGQNHITDLGALEGVPLKWVQLSTVDVEDLAPLRGAPLEQLYIWDAPLRDLAPLKGAPLKFLGLGHRQGQGRNKFTDLAALSDCPLESLWLSNCRNITDFAALGRMKLKTLDLYNTAFADLGLLAHMPLEDLDLRECPIAGGLGVLQGLKTLKKLNGQPVEQVLPYLEQAVSREPVLYTGRWYKVFRDALSWDEAAAFCKELGGHLWIPASLEEAHFVRGLVSMAGDVWTGSSLSPYSWGYFGDKIAFWALGQPPYPPWSRERHSAHFSAQYPGQWETAWAGEKKAFLCVWDQAEKPRAGGQAGQGQPGRDPADHRDR